MIDWFGHLYPYTNVHELNLDWVIATVKAGEKEIKNFVGLNTIKYADPILWDITSQYETNTVVVDGQTGNAYISVQPVPVGVALSRTEYWTAIFNYGTVVDTLMSQIASNEGLSQTATKAYNINDLVFFNSLLYRVISPMIAGDSFVVDSNVVKTTINDELLRLLASITTNASAITTLTGVIGTLSDLTTTDKTSIVNAINEVNAAVVSVGANIGDLADLNTTDKTTVVNAINEVLTIIGDLADLNTTDKTSLVNAINEVLADISTEISTAVSALRDTFIIINAKTDYGAVGDGTTDDTAALQAAIDNTPNNGILVIPKGTYAISSTIYIRRPFVLKCYGEILYTQATGNAIEFYPQGNEALEGGDYYIAGVRSKVIPSITNGMVDSINASGNNGIVVYRMVRCNLHIGRVVYFSNTGVFFDCRGTTYSGMTDNRQIVVHDYIKIDCLGLCGRGCLIMSESSENNCFQANETHFVWILSCYRGISIDSGTYNDTNSNLFLITAIDEETEHGIYVDGHYNKFVCAYIGDAIVFDSASSFNQLEVANTYSTDIVMVDNGTANRITTSMPGDVANGPQLPASVATPAATDIVNSYGVPVVIYQSFTASSAGNIAVRIEPVGTGISTKPFAINQSFGASDSGTVTFRVPNNWHYYVTINNGTLGNRRIYPE